MSISDIPKFFDYIPPNPADVPPPPERLADDRAAMLEKVLQMIERQQSRPKMFAVLRRWKAKGWQR